MIKVTHIITGLNDGGAEAVLYRLCAYQTGEFSHHVVSLTGEGKYGPLLKEAGVAVTCLNMPSGRVTLVGLWRLWRLLRNERPQVVQTWMYHSDLIGGLLARLAGIKKVFWNIRHTTLDVNQSRRSTIAVAWLCARLSRWVPEIIICCAEEAAKVHRSMGYAAKKLVVIPNGYDLSKFSISSDKREKLRAELVVEGRCLLGMVGRFDPQKDHENLLLALAEVKRGGLIFCAFLVGRDVNYNNHQLVGWLKDLDLEDDVRLLGQRTDIPEIMNALDLHILSSSFGEAFPNVLAEAMACGTPCVTTNVGDAALIVGDTGWVVSPKEPRALADAILSSLTEMQCEGEIRSNREKACRMRIIENFSLEKMISSYSTIWVNDKD